MPKDFVIMPETFTMMSGYLELPEVEDIMQEATMSVTGSEDLYMKVTFLQPYNIYYVAIWRCSVG